MSTKTIDDCIDNLIENLDFDSLLIVANALGMEIEYPPTDDMYPDWDNELRVETGKELLKAISFSIRDEIIEITKIKEEILSKVNDEPIFLDNSILLDWADKLQNLF